MVIRKNPLDIASAEAIAANYVFLDNHQRLACSKSCFKSTLKPKIPGFAVKTGSEPSPFSTRFGSTDKREYTGQFV